MIFEADGSINIRPLTGRKPENAFDLGLASIIFYSTGAPDSFHAFQPPAMDQTLV